ncbi:hypothetical protein ABER03_12145, partial [Cutibacterium acnes]
MTSEISAAVAVGALGPGPTPPTCESSLTVLAPGFNTGDWVLVTGYWVAVLSHVTGGVTSRVTPC